MTMPAHTPLHAALFARQEPDAPARSERSTDLPVTVPRNGTSTAGGGVREPVPDIGRRKLGPLPATGFWWVYDMPGGVSGAETSVRYARNDA